MTGPRATVPAARHPRPARDAHPRTARDAHLRPARGRDAATVASGTTTGGTAGCGPGTVAVATTAGPDVPVTARGRHLGRRP